METYIVLINVTQQGITTVKGAPERIERFRQAVEAAGGKVVEWYLTMGRYDIVTILQVPDAQTIAKLLLTTEAQGTIRTETLRAFTFDEAKAIIAGMP